VSKEIERLEGEHNILEAFFNEFSLFEHTELEPLNINNELFQYIPIPNDISNAIITLATQIVQKHVCVIYNTYILNVK